MGITRRLGYEAVRLAAPSIVRLEALRARVARGPRRARRGPPPLRCTQRLKELLAAHYLAGRRADGAVPVAWVTSGFPVEVLRPLGFHVVYPENHAALCAVQHQGVALGDHAEQWGLSRDVCGYARCDIGSWLSQTTPVGRLPRPDLLLACTNICQTVVYWYRTLAFLLDVPLFVLDTPYQYGDQDERGERFVEQQLHELIELAERVAGRPVQREDLARSAREARVASELWGACLELNRNRPAPWTGFDQFIHIGPIVTLRGTPECTAYYRELRDELEDRTRRGIAAVERERYRLLWDNLPIWYELRSLSKMLADRGATIVVTTYTNGWAETAPMFDEADPIHSAAAVYSRVFINRGLGHRLNLVQRLAGDYGCDAAILHANRSCKPYSSGQPDLAAELGSRGLRSLVLEADHIDSRAWSREQVEARLGALLESLA